MRTDTPEPPNASSEPTPTEPAAEPTIVRRKSRNTALIAVIAVVVVVVIVLGSGAYLGWFKGSSSSGAAGTCPTGQALSGNGASFLYPIEQVWSASYTSSTGNTVSYNPAGAGAGITAITDKTVDFGATDEGLTPAQFAALPSTVLTLPVVGGALAIVVNVPGVSQHINLSGPVLAEIYLGTVTTWNNPNITALNPGVALPSSTIVPVVRQDAAGTTWVLTDFLSKASPTFSSTVGVSILPAWPNHPHQANKNSGMAIFVNSTANSIGYVDLADALNTHGGLAIAAVENPAAHFIYPTAANSASALSNLANTTTFPALTANWANVSMINSPGTGDYPLTTFSYFLVYQKLDAGYAPSLAKSQALVQWLTYVITTGQAAAGPNNYAPVPAKVSQLVVNGLATMTYNGAAIPSCTTG